MSCTICSFCLHDRLRARVLTLMKPATVSMGAAFSFTLSMRLSISRCVPANSAKEATMVLMPFWYLPRGVSRCPMARSSHLVYICESKGLHEVAKFWQQAVDMNGPRSRPLLGNHILPFQYGRQEKDRCFGVRFQERCRRCKLQLWP